MGTVDGRKVFVFAHDFRIFGGFSARSSRARSTSCSTSPRPPGPRGGDQRRGGARIQEGITALAGFGGIFVRNVALSGVVPRLSVALGPCAGGAAHSPAFTDFVFTVRDRTNLFITGPDVVEAVTEPMVLAGPLDSYAANILKSKDAHGLASYTRNGNSL
jgi:acetyl-CoA carboxylase carboxyltransferase component